jgi:hypothetical protein
VTGRKNDETKPRAEDTARHEREGRKPAEDREALDHQLDEELEDTFPASDPPSLTQDRH